MDSSQDELGIDNENNRTMFLRESDPFLPVIPLSEIKEEPLEEGLNTPPTTPLNSPHAFLKEDRRLFSPPPVLTVAPTKLDNFKTGFSSTPCDTEIRNKSPVFRKKTTRPASLVLPSEGCPPRKRIKPNTVAALPDHSSQGLSEPPLSGLSTADSVSSNTSFGEKTHHLTCTVRELSSLPDI